MNSQIARELESELGIDEVGRASLRMIISTPITSGEMVFSPGTLEGQAALQRLIDKHIVTPTGRMGIEDTRKGELFVPDPRIQRLKEI